MSLLSIPLDPITLIGLEQLVRNKTLESRMIDYKRRRGQSSLLTQLFRRMQGLWLPRALRIEYDGAMCHVMSRGDRREPIFRDDADRRRFLETLSEVCTKTDWQVHAHFLMGNHFHLVIETPTGNLVTGMKWFLGTFTARFNRRHKLSGHLFSGRYKALVVDATLPGYFRTVCDSVHLNPVRARLLGVGRALREYSWSSYPEYLKPPHAALALAASSAVVRIASPAPGQRGRAARVRASAS